MVEMGNYSQNSFINDIDLPMTPQEQQSMSVPDYGLMGKNDSVEIIKEYLKDDYPISKDGEILGKLKSYFWACFSRNMKLSFFDPKTHPQIFALDFRNAHLNYMMSKPVEEYSYDEEMHIQNVGMNFMASIQRSIGTTASIINERTAPHHQLVRRQDSISGGLGKSGPGILSKIRSMI